MTPDDRDAPPSGPGDAADTPLPPGEDTDATRISNSLLMSATAASRLHAAGATGAAHPHTQGPGAHTGIQPATQGPLTQGPLTQGPVTQLPTTQGWSTQAPATQAPTTHGPATGVPLTLGGQPITASGRQPVSFGPPTQQPGTPHAGAPGRVHGETLPGGTPTSEVTVRQVGRYMIQAPIGRGGMASVFKAHDPGIGRDVAIKFLHASYCADDEYRARFLLEARAAGGLSHPNIVTVHDVGEIEGRPYMAMELLEGEPLAESLSKGRSLPVRDAVVIGIQLAKALGYAHGRGIVHRDIKPGNIMRKGDTIKVTDFGIAHVDSPDSEQRTRVGDVLGTPQYMSPEQTHGQKLDGRSDLFSTGILLYQMLTGKRPFQGETLVAVAMKITKEPHEPIEKLRPEVPASLRRVVDRCLAKAPEKRFQTGEELAGALTRVLQEIDEAEAARNRPKIVPLRVKWAGMMALIVFGVMAVAGTVITQRQHAAMLGQVTENGAALARFLAQHNAPYVLNDEWANVEVGIENMMKSGEITSIVVTDRSGVVRASSQQAQVDKPWAAPSGDAVGKTSSGLPVTRYLLNGESVLGMETAVLFSGAQVGRLWLSVPERSLKEVLRLSIGLMVALVIITVLAVATAMYFVANWFARPIKLVEESMDEVAKGRFDHRIGEARSDEFGRLYQAFDRMAAALQEAQTASTPHPATILPTRTPRDQGRGEP